VCGTTHIGRVRANNQDIFCALELTSPPSQEGVRFSWDSQRHDQEACRCLPWGPRGSLLLVADGMGGGGPAGGEVASRLAVTSTLEAIDRIWNPDGQIIGTAAATAATFAERLRESFVEAHARIQAYAAERPWLHGMGTTATAAGILDRAVVFSHVGGSRAYLTARPAARTYYSRSDLGTGHGRHGDDDPGSGPDEPQAKSPTTGVGHHARPFNSGLAL